MALLPTHHPDQKRRKNPRKASSWNNQPAVLILSATVFLTYVGWRRTSRTDALLTSDGASAHRRGLEEHLGVELKHSLMHHGASHAPVTTFPANHLARRLLVASHSRLAWYHYDSGQFEVIHEGEGVYYGGFPGDTLDKNGIPNTVWVVSRPHNWRPKTSKEWLLEINTATGEVLNRVPLASRFTHDTVRSKDRVYAADTGDGHILELEFPSMKLLRRLQLFTLREHVNTLTVTGHGTLWAVLHNLGKSALAEVDLASGKELRRLENIGVKAHGAVTWQDSLIVLDSNNAALILVDPVSGHTTPLWSSHEENSYLKGLCVVDDVAFFGIAEAQQRQSRDSTDLNCDVAAFDLEHNVLLWRRQLPTKGLLNVLAAPHLQVESTAHAVVVENSKESYRSTKQYALALAAARKVAENISHIRSRFSDPRSDVGDTEEEGLESSNRSKSRSAGGHINATITKLTLLDLEPLPPTDPLVDYPPALGGRWASGFPRLNNAEKDKAHGLSSGAQLPLFKWDHVPLRDYLLSLPDDDWTESAARGSNAFLTGRAGNLNQFKPGTSAIHLIFSDNSGINVYEFPWYKKRFAKFLDPLLEKLLGVDTHNIIRMQFAIMPAHTHIKRHIDRGGYSATGHRIHLVVASSPMVRFMVCEGTVCVPIHVEEGLVFELNNRLDHYVDNDGESARIHLVVDVAESPRKRKQLRVGQVCAYEGGVIKC